MSGRAPFCPSSNPAAGPCVLRTGVWVFNYDKSVSSKYWGPPWRPAYVIRKINNTLIEVGIGPAAVNWVRTHGPHLLAKKLSELKLDLIIPARHMLAPYVPGFPWQIQCALPNFCTFGGPIYINTWALLVRGRRNVVIITICYLFYIQNTASIKVKLLFILESIILNQTFGLFIDIFSNSKFKQVRCITPFPI